MSTLWQEVGGQPLVSDATLKRYLRIPVRRPFSPPVQEANDWAREWFREKARPWTCALEGDERLRQWLAPRFPQSERLVVVAVSAGREAEAEAAARFAADEPDRYYFLECLASAVVDTLLATARVRLGVERHHCPGYPGWPIEDNVPLLAAAQRLIQLPGPLDVLPSGMLKPKKSQLAVCLPARRHD